MKKIWSKQQWIRPDAPSAVVIKSQILCQPYVWRLQVGGGPGMCVPGERARLAQPRHLKALNSLFGMLMGYAFCLQKGMVLLQRIKSFPTPIQGFPVVVLSNSIKMLSELTFTFRFGDNILQCRGTQERQNKESRPKRERSKMRRSSKGSWRKGRGRQSERGRECGTSPCECYLCKAATWNFRTRNRPSPNHIAMSVLAVVLTPVNL